MMYNSEASLLFSLTLSPADDMAHNMLIVSSASENFMHLLLVLHFSVVAKYH